MNASEKETRTESVKIRLKPSEKWDFEHQCNLAKMDPVDVIRSLMGTFATTSKKARVVRQTVKYPFVLKVIVEKEVDTDNHN